MQELNFELRTDLTPISSTTLDANFDECKAALTEMLAGYKDLVVTADGIAAAKTDRANIRKVASRIDEARKTVKSIYTTPLKAFEDRCRELTAICAEASDNLDGQIKAFQEARAEEKVAGLRAYYEAQAGEEDKTFLPFEAVNNPKWRNATYKEEMAQAEIDGAIAKVREDVATLRGMNSPYETALLAIYRKFRDVGRCLREQEDLKRLEEQNAIARQRMAEREAEARRRAVAAEQAQGGTAKTEPPTAAQSAQERPGEWEEVFTIDFRVNATRSQLAALRDFMQRTGIVYSRVPKHDR